MKNNTATSKSVASKKSNVKKSTTPKVVAPVAKKAPRKSISRSSIPTITIPKRRSGNASTLVTASDPESFWTNDGQILNNLIVLAESFAAMDTMLYKYHVQKEQNDFADWVEAVLGDNACAAALRKAKTPKSAYTVVVKHLSQYR